MAAPPWIQGTLFPDAAEMLAHSVEGKLMGGPRHEQLFRATGTLRVGSEEHAFTGSGLRIRRQGVRDITEFWGHAWQSALFPSGRGFGYIAYPPRPDGTESYNEGYLFMGDGDLVPAKVLQAPWLTRLRANGDDVSVVLESDARDHAHRGRDRSCRPSSSASRSCRSSRCSTRAGRATAGTARRPTGCSNVRRWRDRISAQ